jgi:hypothetical protein
MSEEDESGWTLEAIFQLGGGVQVAVASTAPLSARDWYYFDVTKEIVNDRKRLDRQAGGLAWCTVCCAAEGELLEECPGRKLTSEARKLCYEGEISTVDALKPEHFA